MKEEVREKWWMTVSSGIPEDLNPDERDTLRAFLLSTAGVKACTYVLGYAGEIGRGLLKTSLATPEAIYEATLRQGQVSGIVRTIELLGSLTQEEEGKNDGRSQ